MKSEFGVWDLWLDMFFWKFFIPANRVLLLITIRVTCCKRTDLDQCTDLSVWSRISGDGTQSSLSQARDRASDALRAFGVNKGWAVGFSHSACVRAGF